MRSKTISDADIPHRPPLFCGDCPIGEYSLYGPTLRANPGAVTESRKDVRTIPAERTIIRENSVPNEFFTIFSGWAYIYKVLPDGRRQIIAFLIRGDVFSLWSVAAPGNPIGYSFRSLTPLTLCVFDLGIVMKAFKNASAEQNARFQWTMERAHNALARKIVDLGRRSARGRICQLILEQERRLRERGMSDGKRFGFPLKHVHIADALGLTSVYVGRTLADLRKERIFELYDSVATIRDHAALVAIADE